MHIRIKLSAVGSWNTFQSVQTKLIVALDTGQTVIVRGLCRTLMVDTGCFVGIKNIGSFLKNICHIWKWSNPSCSLEFREHVSQDCRALSRIYIENRPVLAWYTSLAGNIKVVGHYARHTACAVPIRCLFRARSGAFGRNWERAILGRKVD